MSEGMSYTEIALQVYAKGKTVILAFIASYVAATMHYFRDKKEGKKPTTASWLYFGVTAFMVTYTVFAVIAYMYSDLPLPLVLAIGFWFGYMSDYVYIFIPRRIKMYLDNEPNINFKQDVTSKQNDDNG